MYDPSKDDRKFTLQSGRCLLNHKSQLRSFNEIKVIYFINILHSETGCKCFKISLDSAMVKNCSCSLACCQINQANVL